MRSSAMRSERRRLAGVAAAVMTLAMALPLRGDAAWASTADRGDDVVQTLADALEDAFGDAEVERARHVLDDAARKAIAKASGDAGFDQKVVFEYVARDAQGKVLGYAYFDAHRVRTKRETVMFVVAPDGALRGVQVLAFQEPRQYLPKSKWYEQFEGRVLDAKLRLGSEIDVCTGATITSRVTTLAARRALAIHALLHPQPTPKPIDGGGGSAVH